jgi:hypothetical protein
LILFSDFWNSEALPLKRETVCETVPKVFAIQVRFSSKPSGRHPRTFGTVLNAAPSL